MTADIRTAAQREAVKRHPDKRDCCGAVSPCYEHQRQAFAAGAVWGAARVTPTREEIAVELRKHKLVHVSVSRKSAFCTCNSSVKAGTDANLEWFESHRANAILALIAGLAEGEAG